MPKHFSQEESKYRFYVAQDDLFIDLNLIQFGFEKCDPLHEWGPAVRNHFLFHYVIDGKGILEKHSGIYEISKGQGFLICPHEVCSYRADSENPWYYAWFEFDGLRARQTLTLAGLSENQPVYNSIDPNSTAIQDLLLQIVRDAEKSTLYLTGMSMVLLDEIARTSRTRVEEQKKNVRDFYMKEAMTYIEGNYMRDISIEEIADSSGLNRSYFSRVFKATFGESPQQFLMKYRMNKAAELLSYTNLSIAEIGSSVSYENQLHFSRAFKNLYGISPSGYRAQHQVVKK